MRTRPRVRAAAAVLGALLGGCGAEPPDFPREPVTGSVTLDGRPLDHGLITFTPVDRPEPVVSGVVTDGAFTLPRADGPAAGPHRVAVWAQKPTGKKVRDPDRPGQTVDEVRSVIPERYNARTELTAEVRPGGDNAFTFSLSGSTPRAARTRTTMR